MSIKPLVSVITIFLNEEKFIQEAIESVIAQTYNTWELLLVDDGSNDKSSTIAKGYAGKWSEKVHYLEHDGHQNRGMGASRNLGISYARGEYIAFLDADDVWLPHKLEQQVAIMDSHPEAAMVCGRTQWWYSWTGNSEDSQRDFLQKLDVPLNTLVKPPVLLILFLQDEWASLCDILVRKQIVEAVGGYEESFRGMYEDQAFHAKLCLASPAFVSSECWYHYRQHSNSCVSMSSKNGNYPSARQAFLNWLETYLSRQEIQDPEVRQVLQKELWHFCHPILSRISGRIQHPVQQIKRLCNTIGRRTLPARFRHWLWTQCQVKKTLPLAPPVGWVHMGSLRRVTPISRNQGYDRGLPIDRFYIEKFLGNHLDDFSGRLLEIGDDTYTRKFGGDRVTQSDVLHSPIGEIGPLVTIVADITCADHIPSDTFDCIILTQTLQFIYDIRAAIRTLHRILKPGGIALVTVPGITQIIRDDMEVWGEYWRFTKQSSQLLFEEVFPAANVRVEAHGNVLAATAFLHGLATQELRQLELDYCDSNYEVLITVRAQK